MKGREKIIVCNTSARLGEQIREQFKLAKEFFPPKSDHFLYFLARDLKGRRLLYFVSCNF